MKVLTFGETLFRFSTLKGERLLHSHQLNFYLGGTELNIAANLSSLGVPSGWVSCLPDGMTGELIRDRIRELSVDISRCETIPGGRAGWYLVESGAEPRPDVVLNRNASSFSEVKIFPFNWEEILKGTLLFHTSGITAGLSVELTEEVKRAMTAARKKNILVSYDFNYRKNIWTMEESIKRQMPLLPLVDILFCAESDLELFFQKDPKSSDYAKVFDSCPALKYIVISTRSSDETEYGLKVVARSRIHQSRKYNIQKIDRIGVGDSMAAGFLAGLLKKDDLEEACEWGALAGAMKYGIKGDMALLKEREITTVLKSGVKGIIR